MKKLNYKKEKITEEKKKKHQKYGNPFVVVMFYSGFVKFYVCMNDVKQLIII